MSVVWCSNNCRIPIISNETGRAKNCPLCNGETRYLATDLRPVFPEERLLFELLLEKPLAFLERSVWAQHNRYYIDGKTVSITAKHYRKFTPKLLREKLVQYQDENNYDFFDKNIADFVKANQTRLNSLVFEAEQFIKEHAEKYPAENIVLSFSGGKDSTVTTDLVIKALSNPTLVHLFGDTTLEFPLTLEYAKRYRANHLQAIFKTAKNKEQNFYTMCEDIGPPARMLRWCCTTFKTGPISRKITDLYGDNKILTFYGIRKNESLSRSKYSRITENSEHLKIQQQTVASPIFEWSDLDVWLYILANKIDFNEAYRLGWDRVGCWCCPNNGERAQFLSAIYMPEQFEKWHLFLVDFAMKIGKPDPEEYVSSGAWKARQGGNGVHSAEDIKIKFTNCTAEENAKVYQLNKPIGDSFYELFVPFGKIAKELGRKLVQEVIITDLKTNVPIISIQPLKQTGYEHAVKIKTLNVKDHAELQRQISYQIRKYNACRRCLKCESVCKFGAISVANGEYHVKAEKCKHCKMCVNQKYIGGGCLMQKMLRVKEG